MTQVQKTGRICVMCREPSIFECMGFCLARDVSAHIEGRGGPIREVCGRCTLPNDGADALAFLVGLDG